MTALPNRWLVLAAILAANLPVILDITILHVAVPSLTVALAATGSEALWIIDTYSLVMAGLLVPMGTLADRIGYRRVLLMGLGVFGLASVVVAFSTTPELLIAARACLAVGAAMIMPTVLAVIRRTFHDPKELAIAFGIWTTVSSAGAAVGPVVGGALLEYFWWGSVFLINVPVMLIVFPAVLKLIPRDKPRPLAGWNVRDALLLLSGLILSVYAIKASVKADGVMIAIATGMAGLSLIGWFVLRQLKAAEPMLDLSLFRTPVLTAGLVMAMVASGSIAGFELVLIQELQYVYNMSPLQAGLYMTPFVLVMAVSGPLVGRLSGWIGLRATATLGLAGAASALAGLALADLAGDYWKIAALLGLLGLSLAAALLSSSVAVMSSVAVEKSGAAGSLESTGYELGAGLGITGFGVLLISLYRGAFEQLAPGAPAGASDSIGEAMVQAAGHADEAAIVTAAQTAFSSAHGSVLGVAAALIAALTVFVFIALRRYHPVENGGH